VHPTTELVVHGVVIHSDSLSNGTFLIYIVSDLARAQRGAVESETQQLSMAITIATGRSSVQLRYIREQIRVRVVNNNDSLHDDICTSAPRRYERISRPSPEIAVRYAILCIHRPSSRSL
jgi:hypothetical protein